MALDNVAGIGPVDAALSRMLSLNRVASLRAAEFLVKEFMDQGTGMLIVPATTGQSRRFYTRPLALLAYLRLIAVTSGTMNSPSLLYDEPLARDTGGAGMTASDQARRVAAYAERLAEPPELPMLSVAALAAGSGTVGLNPTETVVAAPAASVVVPGKPTEN